MEPSYACVFFLLLSCSSHSQSVDSKALSRPIWQPPKVLDEFPQDAKSTASPDIIKSLQVSRQRIVLETTALVALQKTVGGVIGHRGDAGDSLSWLCLYGSDSDGTWVLWLLSSEIDDGSIGGFTWQFVKNTTSIDSRCSARSEKGQIIKLPVPLRLGMTKDEVLLVLGKPSTQTDDTLFYLHEHELTLHNQPYTDMNTVGVVLSRKKVVSIEVWKSTTS